MRESAGAFAITQLGISCFARHPDAAPNAAAGADGPGGGGGEQWTATTFNAYIFPEPSFGNGAGGGGGGGGGGTAPAPAPRFVCDASSLAFLARHSFDFNK